MEIATHKKRRKYNNLSFVGALPGVGNVGKIAVEYIVKKLKATKIQTITFPDTLNSVIITKSNTLALPTVELYHKRVKGKDMLFLTGELNVDNTVEIRQVLQHCKSYLKEHNCQKIVTLAGIGMEYIPEKPEIYATVNMKSGLKNFNLPKTVKKDANKIVRNINGFSGLLPTLASDIDSCCLLTETFNSQFFLGYKSAKEVVKVISKSFGVEVCLKELNQEIKEFDKLLDTADVEQETEEDQTNPSYFN